MVRIWKKVASIKEDGVIDMQGRRVGYTIKTHSQARRIKVSVSSDAVVRIIMPSRMSIVVGLQFVRDHQDWIIRALARRDARPRIPLPKDAPSRRYYRIARRIALEKVSYFNEYYNFPYTGIRIKDIRTKWGSCSSKGNLNFNYKLQFLPTHLIDYIIVHELCHLKEMNHGENFWKLVGHCIPDAQARKKELRMTNVY